MQSKKKDNLIIVRLFPDESIYEKLEEVCRKYDVKTAVVLSGIGQLKRFKLGYFRKKGDYAQEYYEKTHELISLTGNICNNKDKYEFHVHATLGNEKKEAMGGHLIEGAVDITNEISLLITDMSIERKTEEKTGLRGLFLE